MGRATVPCNTACPPSRLAPLRRINVVVGKNYRLQNIQLSKISLPDSSGQSVNVGWVWRARLRTSPFGNARQQRSANQRPTSACARLNSLTRPPKLFQRAPRPRGYGLVTTSLIRCWPHSANENFCSNVSRTSLCEKLVENTGLEPVTSWLQTRRSPS